MHTIRSLWFSFATALTLTVTLLGAGMLPAFAEDDFRMSPEAALQYIAETPDIFVLDVRTPQEYAEKHLAQAVNIPVEELEGRLSELPLGRPVLIHCRAGVRAERAYNMILEKKPETKPLHIVRGQVTELLQ